MTIRYIILIFFIHLQIICIPKCNYIFVYHSLIGTRSYNNE